MSWLVWSNIGPAGGEQLDNIIARKEAERTASNGVFWWGLGTRLGSSVAATACVTGGTLPTIFSKILGKAQEKDVNPAAVCLWNGWQSVDKLQSGKLPDYALVTGGQSPSDEYYALACKLQSPLKIGDHGIFDRKQYRTRNGKQLGWSQRAALLENPQAGGTAGREHVAFQAELIAPWYVKLTHGRVLTESEMQMIQQFGTGDNWLALVKTLRRSSGEKRSQS